MPWGLWPLLVCLALLFLWVLLTREAILQERSKPARKRGGSRNKSNFPAALKSTIETACLDELAFASIASDLQAAHEAGDSRATDRLLREGCPADMWDWPEYTAWAEEVGEKPTRLRMVAAMNHHLWHLCSRLDEIDRLKQITDRRPIWQVRAADDGNDPPACAKLNNRSERWDHPFWRTTSRKHIRQCGCRCIVRSMSQEDFDFEQRASSTEI